MQNEATEVATPLDVDGNPLAGEAAGIFSFAAEKVDALVRYVGNVANSVETTAQGDAIFAHLSTMPLLMVAAGMMHRAAIAGEPIPSPEAVRAEVERQAASALDQAIPFMHKQMLVSIERGEHLKHMQQQPGEAAN